MTFHHIPVLLEEAIQALDIKPDGVYVDGTAGGAGHSLEIAKRLDGGRLIAIDKDSQAVCVAGERLSPYACAQVVQGDFAATASVLDDMGISGADGILLDLGTSSYQLDNPERGFSYRSDAPLIMRMADSGPTAADILNEAPVSELADIFRRYGEEKFAGSIARNIVRARERAPLDTTFQLVEIIRNSIPAAARRAGGHPAKRVFQALRVAVNGELDSLKLCLDKAFQRLNPGGRFVVITFQSLEDRIVKQTFVKYAGGCVCPPDFPVCVCGNKPLGRLVYKKPVLPGSRELEDNPRSKSAKLRCMERL